MKQFNPVMATTEKEVRRLRDLVYDQTSSDGNWEACSKLWLINVEWLEAEAERIRNLKWAEAKGL